MNVKKVSYISLVLAGLLLVFTATAFATNSPEQQIADDIDESDIIAFDYYSIAEGGDSDEVLYTLQNMNMLQNLTEQLAPYEPFGLTWTFDDQDMDGQGLKMYYQGREVRGIYDDTTGSWFTEHAGCIGFAPDAVELFTVYTDGQLSGLRFATAEEQAQFDETRRQSSRQLTAEYEPFGVELNEQGQLVYNGQLVRYFWDGFEIWEDNELIGRAIHFEYTNPQNGEIDLRTIRGVSYNLDGSTNGFGQLQGVKVYVEPDVAAMQNPSSQQTAIAVYTADSLSAQGKTIGEIMSEYAEFGLEYREDVTSNGISGNIYFNGELMTAFIDQKPDGQRTFSVQSYPKQDGAEAVVLTEYDEQGRLIGLRRASREEANAYLAEHRLESVRLQPGDDENSGATDYSQQTAAQS